MVIPVGGDPPIAFGPPPEQLLGRLKRIKACLVTLIVALVLKLVGQILLRPWLALNIIVDSLDALLVALVGVFLMKDDPLFRPVYAFLMGTCCRGCEGQCPGGVSCLCTWFAVCLITALTDLFGDVGTVYVGFRLIFDPSYPDKYEWNFKSRSAPWFICMIVYMVGVLLALLAQILGAWQGMKGFTESQALLDPLEGLEGGAWGGGLPYGGAQQGQPPYAYGVQPQPSAPPGEGPAMPTGPGQRLPPPRGFEPFAGQGQRLG